MNPKYGITKHLPRTSVEEARERAIAALKVEGFGVLTEIDVQKTLKEKLGVDHPPYRILGACNPPLAYRALQGDPGVGLLLPCNVVVAAHPDGGSVVSVVDPRAMFSVVDHPGLAPVVAEVEARLRRVIASL